MKSASAAIFLLGFTIRVALVLVRHDYLHPLADESVRVARSIDETGVFGNPWIIPTGATAQIAPVQPFLISLTYRVFGEGSRGELARHVVGCAASSLIYAALPYAAVAFELPLQAGLIAGGVGALLPLKYHTEVSGAWESPWVALTMILLTARAAARLRLNAIKPLSALLDGLFWGAGILISPALLPVLFGLVVLEGYHFLWRSQPGRYVSFLALRLAMIAFLLTPWTIRNYRTFGIVCPVRCSFGLEFYTGNNPQAHLLQADNFWSGAPHPTVNPAECARLIELGEAGYNREKLQLALESIREQPTRFLYFTVARTALYWLSWTPSLAINLTTGMIEVLGLVGMVMLIRLRNRAAPIILSIWITYPVIYYVMQSSTKYRYPMDWTLLLLAGLPLFHILTRNFTLLRKAPKTT